MIRRTRIHRFRIVSLVIFSTVTGILGAGIAAVAAERVALVIGIDDYQHTAPLNNAIADSRLVARVLRETGFDVVSLENPGVDALYEGLDHMKRRSALATVGIVYFAGHGVEVENENYLLPVDAELERAVQLRSQAIALETILEDLSEAKLEAKVVVLDCCRDNPLKRSWMTTRSVGRGLAPILDVNMPEASLVVYSAGPGQVALDGVDGNSPFTKALANRLIQPGQNLLQVFLKTSDDVVDQTGGRQEPWVKMDAAGRAMRELVLVPATTRPASNGAGPAKVATAPGAGTAPPPAAAPPAQPGSSGAMKPDQPGKEPAAAPAASSPVGNGADPAPLANAASANAASANAAADSMKPKPKEEVETSPPTSPAPPGNQPAEAPAETVQPLVLPSRGYFSNTEIFAGGPYAGYNTYAKTGILKKAQARLPEAGTPDGIMGSRTQSALIDYQKSNRIPVTGVLDASTLAAMGLTGLPEEAYTPPKRTYSSTRSSGSSGSSSGSHTQPSSPPPASPSPGSSRKKKSGGGFYQPPTGKTGMSHAEKKFLRPR